MLTIALGLIGLAQAAITVAAFTLMGRAHAKQVQFLVNAALAKTPQEFAFRQVAAGEAPAEKPESEPEQFPEGL